MDHNMVLSYDYAKQKRRWQQTNAPPLQTILMAMQGIEAIHVALPDG